MGMRTSVVAIRPPDEKWLQMKAVYDACLSADIEVPDEVWEFFNHERPDNAGVLMEIEEHECVSAYNGTSSAGFEVEIAKLPKDIKIIRFFNSW